MQFASSMFTLYRLSEASETLGPVQYIKKVNVILFQNDYKLLIF